MAEKLSGTQRINIATMMTGAFLIFLNQTLLAPALPVLMADFKVDATVVQWVTSGYSLVMAVVIPLSPFLLGRFGSRRLFIASMASFAIGSITASLAPAFPAILLGRVFQAIACGMVTPMAFTIVLLEFPRERRGSAMGIVMLVVGCAPTIGPTLSGILVETVGWRMLFAMVALVALAICLIAIRFLGKGPRFEQTVFDKLSVLLSSVGLVALLYGLSSFTKSDSQTISLALITGGTVLVAIFAVRQLHLEVPLVRVSVLKTGRFRATVMVNMLNVAISTGMSVMLPLFIQNLLGHTPFMTGLTMLPGAAISAFVGLFAGRLFDRKGIRICVVPGIMLVTAALIAMSLLFDRNVPLLVVGLAYGSMIIGLQLINTTVGTWGLNALDNNLIQHAQATGNTLNQVAGSLVTAVVVSMTALGANLAPAGDSVGALEAGYHLGFLAIMFVTLIDFAICMVFIRERKAPAKAAQPAEPKLSPEPETTLVGSVMNSNPYSVPAGSSLRDVAKALIDNRTSGMPVVDRENKVVGFISDGDLMSYLGNEDTDLLDPTLTIYRFIDPEDFNQRTGQLLELAVERVMTRDAVSVDENMELGKACMLLSKRQLKKVPVVDGEGVLVGTLSRSDIVRSTLAGLVAASN